MDPDKRHYIFNLETTKIELHFDKADYDALADEQKSALKSAFLWSSRNQCWVSRAKEPNLWRAKQVATGLGFTEEQREGERLTFEEQLERQSARAEFRADRYEQYAENAERRREQLQKPLEHMHGDSAFFTQPITNSTAGRAFAKYRNQLFDRYHRGFEEYRKSEYFRSRARTARGTASQAQYRDPAYLDRRIKECQKEIRDREKNITSYEETLSAIEGGQEKKRYNGEVITPDEVRGWLQRELELIEKAVDKQAYLENCLDDLGGIRFSKDNVKVGYIARMARWGPVEIVSTGPQNIGYIILTGGAKGLGGKAAYAEISEIIKAEERKPSPQPFQVGEKFTATHRDYGHGLHEAKTTEVVFEIIKASDTTIRLKAVGMEGKPITRKPAKTHDGQWCFSINNIYGNTFYKAAPLQEAGAKEPEQARPSALDKLDAAKRATAKGSAKGACGPERAAEKSKACDPER